MGARESGCAGMPGSQPALLDTRDCPEQRDPVQAGLARGVLGCCLRSPGLCRSCRAIIPRAREGPCAPKGSQGWGALLHLTAVCVGVCVVGRRGWTPPVSQPGELSQEIPAGPAGSRLSHFAELSKCPCWGRGAPAPLGGQGLPTHAPAVPRPWPRVTPSLASPLPQFPHNVFLGLGETEGMSRIPARELALRGQGEDGREVGMGTVGRGEICCSLGGEWYPQGRI